MTVDHLVLTRFSSLRRAGAEPLAEDWLRYRLAFFYDTCHPSLTRQVGADFRWLVFLDDRCPDDFRADVEQLAEGAFEPVWGHAPFREELDRVVAGTTGSHLITTRVDSDDAVARDFVARVREQFADQDRLYVNFTRGLQVDRSGSIYRRDQPSGPFISLIEARSPDRAPDTVYATKHARARTRGPVREVRTAPMWLQVVHGGNLRNIVVGPRVSPRVVADRFDIDLRYRTDVSLPRLVAEKVRHRGWLAGEWTRHPGRFVEALDVAALRLQGTRTRPADPRLATRSERLRQRAIRLGYRPRSHG